MGEKIRVLIADDSALMRRSLKHLVESDIRFEVIEVARDGEDAVNKVRELNPDVVTMDINMPKMDGLTALQIIIDEKICPVIVVSSLSQEGAVTTFEALELGAFECIGKPGGTVSKNIDKVKKELLESLYSASQTGKRKTTLKTLSTSKNKIKHMSKIKPKKYNGKFKAIALGISTGGPKVIYDVLPFLPKNLNAAVFIVQHMPPNFTASYAERLNKNCEMNVVEAKDKMVIKSGTVYIGKGGKHLKLRERMDGEIVIRLSSVPKEFFVPSVNVMMEAVSKIYKERTIGVLMTGMGKDGANSMEIIKENGGATIAESEETAIVFGMPNEAIKRGVVDEILPSYQIAESLIKKVGIK
ncbi:MAG: chemotaxis response regulator protein-glutamate methylesterase [Fusobacteriia bacterium 4572_132]|nr:MAG: chemotaxis response regulator protein-glutamate methylesterase [Fusobacteriia bacterium 4572_132]